MKLKIVLALAVWGIAGAAAADSWQVYSRSTSNAFIVEVDGIVVADGISTVKVATVPRAGDAGDYSHSIETYQYRCADAKWRTAGMIDYGPDGVELDTVPEEDAAWESTRPNTAPEFLKTIVCDGNRITTSFPDIKAFIDGGRTG
ncbi:MAG: hypothetical protein EON89_04770 [Brevundimonas sp.]|nr:MAG: hypothetical protein EON89_04770 [Brevundimonas sp.]